MPVSVWFPTCPKGSDELIQQYNVVLECMSQVQTLDSNLALQLTTFVNLEKLFKLSITQLLQLKIEK